MNQQGSIPSMDPAKSHPQGYSKRTQRQLVTSAKVDGKPHPNRIRNLLGWLIPPCLIAITMQACGWLSLHGAEVLIVEDTRARIQADYSPWPFLSFMPIDSAILEEISKHTGRTINVNLQDSSDSSLWGNSTPLPKETDTGIPTSTPLCSETPPVGIPSPTATLESTIDATPTSTPVTTSTATIPPTATTIPPSPTDDKPGNQYFNYTSTPEPPVPTDPGNSGSGDDDQSDTKKN